MLAFFFSCLVLFASLARAIEYRVQPFGSLDCSSDSQLQSVIKHGTLEKGDKRTMGFNEGVRAKSFLADADDFVGLNFQAHDRSGNCLSEEYGDEYHWKPTVWDGKYCYVISDETKDCGATAFEYWLDA